MPQHAPRLEDQPTVREFRIPVFNFGLWRTPLLAAFLGQPAPLAWLPWGKKPTICWLGWGCKPSAKRAALYARLANSQRLSLEDGFLRSWGPGNLYPPLSLVVDDVGIYYDSTGPSALENLLNAPIDLLAGIEADVARAKALILEHRLSKYNHAPHLEITPIDSNKLEACQRVLVVDQTEGDLSVQLGSANADTFAAMLSAARTENPQAIIYIKTHPEVSAGRKRGYLTLEQDDARTVVLRQAINPLGLIEQMSRVYVVSSTMGFEAVLAGKPVSVFGLPWYAGWGVTDDRQLCARRTRKRSVTELFAAAYFHYARYLNPETHLHGTIFDVIEWLLRQREAAERCRGRMIAVGFSGIRRWAQAALFGPDISRVAYAANGKQLAALQPDATDCLVHWGHPAPVWLQTAAQDCSARLLHMEDGFIRSVGLGSDLVPPQSFVLDERGLYFDPGSPSDLEEILNHAAFPDAELQRARLIREFIVNHCITKYNVDPLLAPRWNAQGRQVALVPGQVEDDASILQGCETVRTNLALLKAARNACPEAYLVYKPHPDILAGNRRGHAALNQALKIADYIETDVSLVSCIEASSEVHTMTSLAGFEALLRGKRVVVYGRPFYAGWGLTEDRLRINRRSRTLTLDAMVAGTLLRYPVYWDALLKGVSTCESVMYRIVEQRDTAMIKNSGAYVKTGLIRHSLLKLSNLLLARIR